MFYITRQLKIGKSKQLDVLSRNAGIVYSKTVTTFWRTYRHSNHWLSLNAMQRIIRSETLHSQTVQGIIQSFYEALRSWDVLRKNNPSAKPPRLQKKHYSVPFKLSAIRIKEGQLILSTGRGNAPLSIPWSYEMPAICEITYNGSEYVLNAVYRVQIQNRPTGGGYAGIDFGGGHLAAICTGENTIIANGKELKSKRHYSNKVRSRFQREMKKCKKNSRKWTRLNNAKQRTLSRLNNQIKDILHKQTNAIVCIMKEEGIQTVGISVMRNPDGNRAGQLPICKVREMVEYKSEHAGMKILPVNDENAGHICPKCLQRNFSQECVYRCVNCGAELRCDCVGAFNIRNLSLYRGYVPVIGDMTPPVGVRYSAGTPRKSAA